MKTINVLSIKLKSFLYNFLILSIFALTSIYNTSFGQVQLDLQNTLGKIANLESTGNSVSMDFITNSGPSGYIGATIGGFDIGSSSKDLRLLTGTGGTCVWTNSNGGRFGIDNVSPNSKLHVSLIGTDGITIDGNDTGDAQLMIENGGGTHRMYDDDTDAHALKIESAGFKPIIFNTGEHERMIIESTGDVGIGEGDPKAPLHITDPITGKIRLDGASSSFDFYDGTTYKGYLFQSSTDDMYLTNRLDKSLFFETDDLTRMTIDETGDVGIGITTPQATLHITDTNNEKIRLDGASSLLGFYDGTTWKGYLWQNSSNHLILNNRLNASLFFRTNDITRMTIAEFGYIGIGTESPNEKLHIIDFDKPALLIQSDGTDEESGRVSLRQSNFSGADILYDGKTGNDVFAIETFSSGNSNGYKMIMDLAGDVNIVEDLTIGSSETFSDAGSLSLSLSSELIPTDHLDFDLGFSPSTNAWDDVFADEFVNASDIRLKEDIQNMEYGLNEILSLSPISYKLIADPQEDTKLGLSAQELLEVIPEAVKTHDIKRDEEGNTWIEEMEYMGVSYNRLVPVLINAVKEQNALFEQQKTILEQQQSYIESLEARINALEK